MELQPALRSPGVMLTDPLFPLDVNAAPAGLVASRHALDDHRCTACGFASLKYQMVLQKCPEPRSVEDLSTLCRSCWQVMNLEVAVAARSAALVWLPEISQIELNRTMPAWYVARVTKGAAAGNSAARVLKRLFDRRAESDRRTGLGNLAGLAEALRDGDQASVERLLAHFDDGLRVLPLDRWIVRQERLEYNQYPQMLAYFRSSRGPLHRLPETLSELGSEWMERLGDNGPETGGE